MQSWRPECESGDAVNPSPSQVIAPPEALIGQLLGPKSSLPPEATASTQLGAWYTASPFVDQSSQIGGLKHQETDTSSCEPRGLQ